MWTNTYGEAPGTERHKKLSSSSVWPRWFRLQQDLCAETTLWAWVARMSFEIRLRNGYTGETVKIIVTPEETPEALAERLRTIWPLPLNPHTLLYEGKILERKAPFSVLKIRSGSEAEVVPDPRILG